MVDYCNGKLCELCDPGKENSAVDAGMLSLGYQENICTRQHRFFYICADCRSRYFGFVLDRIQPEPPAGILALWQPGDPPKTDPDKIAIAHGVQSMRKVNP